MTKAEAIAMLKRIQEPEAWEPQINQAAFEALDMAIEALSQESSEDVISRQAAIEAIRNIKAIKGTSDDKILLIDKAEAQTELMMLPSAEKPFKLPEIYVAEGFDTVEDEDGNIGFGVYVPAENKIYVAGDVEDEIRARALLHEVCHWVQDMCGRPFGEDEANEFSDIVYDAMPSVQPEQRYTEEELRVFQHGISLSLLSKRSAQHWQYDENTTTEIKFLERLYEKVGADIRGEEV